MKSFSLFLDKNPVKFILEKHKNIEIPVLPASFLMKKLPGKKTKYLWIAQSFIFCLISDLFNFWDERNIQWKRSWYKLMIHQELWTWKLISATLIPQRGIFDNSHKKN